MPIREFSRSAWFITESSSIIHILKQFRRNNQSMAVVLTEAGTASGILTLDLIVDEIFGRKDEWEAFGRGIPHKHVFLERTFPADTLVVDFNRQFEANLPGDGDDTLGELVARSFNHIPVEGESVRFENYELVVEEATLLGARTILVRSIS
jgi:Mg2+/Co2+ transporter CorC